MFLVAFFTPQPPYRGAFTLSDISSPKMGSVELVVVSIAIGSCCCCLLVMAHDARRKAFSGLPSLEGPGVGLVCSYLFTTI